MKLTEEMKKKIDAYFERKSAEEVEEILKRYGIEISPKENIEERPVGDVFEFEGTKLKVVKSMDSACFGCYFNTTRGCKHQNMKGIGACDKKDRSDRNYVKFIKASYQQFKQLLNENNMETKEVKIQVPEGYEIDKENSTFELIKFKPIKKVLTYEDVAEELFFGKGMCYTTYDGSIINVISCSKSEYKQPNNFTSEKQAQKLLAINRLMNVARYLNGDWQPDWSDGTSQKYYLSIKKEDSSITTDFALQKCSEVVHFKTLYLAQQAIEILGEETIKLALSTDW